MSFGPKITICGEGELCGLPREEPWTHVISIWDWNRAIDEDDCRMRIEQVAGSVPAYFAFFDDTSSEDDERAPTQDVVEMILRFTSKLTAESHVLIHCRMGISRSAAVAFAIACQHGAPGLEDEALRYIKSRRPHMMPNRLITSLADRYLKRSGRMTELVMRYQGFLWE